jgi:hypothetical protein
VLTIPGPTTFLVLTIPGPRDWQGDVVRVLTRVDELAKEVRTAARLLGDAKLGKTLDATLDAIKRDVIAAPSLYTDELVCGDEA